MLYMKTGVDRGGQFVGEWDNEGWCVECWAGSWFWCSGDVQILVSSWWFDVVWGQKCESIVEAEV